MTINNHQNTSDNFLRGAVLLLIFWLPLPLGSNRGWAGSLFIVIIALLASIWAIAQLKKSIFNNNKVLRNDMHSPTSSTTPQRTALLLLALLASTQVWVAIQWAAGLSVDSGETFRHLLLGGAYCLLFWLVINLFHSRNTLILLLIVLVASGTFQAFFGAFMTLSGTEWLLFGPKEHYRSVVTGTFVNRNHLAGYLEMTLACGIGLMLALQNTSALTWRNLLETLLSGKIILRLTLAIMVIGLVMTHSRMGNLAFFSSLLLVGGIYILTQRKHRLRNALIIASLLAIDMLVISQYFGLDRLMERLMNTRIESVVVNGDKILHRNEGRLELFAYAFRQFSERPLTGFGAGSFEASFSGFQGHAIRGDFDHAHNDYLQFAIEFGLIGVIPLALFVAFAFCQALRALWQRKSPYHSGVGFAASMGILALLLHSTADFNLQIPANAATFILLCAVAVIANQIPPQHSPRHFP